MSSRPVISIVVPAYNAVHTLCRAVESLTAQTLKELEVWIVDDGSTDDTPHVADALASEDPRVHVIHKANEGCYSARLAGLRRITGKWFGFLDADDFVEPSMYGRMVSVAERENLDALQIDPVGEDNGTGLELFPSQKTTRAEYVVPILLEGRRAALVWDKIYRNQYDYSSFPHGFYGPFEDHVFNLLFFQKISAFGWLHEQLYHYDVNAGSAVKNFRWSSVEGLLAAHALKREIVRKYMTGDADPAVANWLVKNLGNALWLASTARKSELSESIDNVRRIVRLDELANALRCANGRYAIMMRVARCVPAAIMVRLFRAAFPLRGLARHLVFGGRRR